MKLHETYIILENEYLGDHTAPDKSDSSMDDVSDSLPDIYSDKGYKYYGNIGLDSYSMVSLVKSVEGEPRESVKIYRAVPDINYDITVKIKELNNIWNYHHKFGFFPVNNKLVDSLELEFKHIKGYEELQKAVLLEIEEQINELLDQKKKGLKINKGDWVTPSLLYAKEHGQSNLDKFKIATKTVKASELYTDGNSIFEWGYN